MNPQSDKIMSTTLQKPSDREALKSSMARLDAIANESALLSTQGSPFTLAVTMANAIGEIREALTDEVMNSVIMPLMNSKLGFRTDKDPARPAWDKKTSRYASPEPYGVEIVRECAIEAILRGLPIVGNCWNIISAQTYVTKEGFWFLLGKRVPGLTDLKVLVGVPKMLKPPGDARNASNEEAKGAVVSCSASWKLNGATDRVEREIPIRVNAMMGADAIMGKAERKVLAAAHAQITGTALGDADATELELELRNVSRPADDGGGGIAETNPLASTAPPEHKPTPPREFTSEKEERSALSTEIRDAVKAAGITLPAFEVKAKQTGALDPEETLAGGKIPIGKLRLVHEQREAIANYQETESGGEGELQWE